MEPRDEVVDEVVERGPSTAQETLLVIERGHRTGPGVERDVLEGYVDAFAERSDFAFDPEAFHTELESALVDDEEWVEPDAVYRVGDDRLSRFPARWHEELGGSDDVAAFVEFLQGSEFAAAVGGSRAGGGVDEQELLHVVAAVGRMPYDEAKSELERLREEGVVVEDADQHPRADVYLADDAEELRDPALDGS